MRCRLPFHSAFAGKASRRSSTRAEALLTSTLVLLRNVAKAHHWFEMLKQGQSFAEIAQQEKLSARRIQQLMDHAFLAPDITRSIIAGKQAHWSDHRVPSAIRNSGRLGGTASVVRNAERLDASKANISTPRLLASQWQTETGRLFGAILGLISRLCRDHVPLTAGNDGRIPSSKCQGRFACSGWLGKLDSNQHLQSEPVSVLENLVPSERL